MTGFHLVSCLRVWTKGGLRKQPTESLHLSPAVLCCLLDLDAHVARLGVGQDTVEALLDLINSVQARTQGARPFVTQSRLSTCKAVAAHDVDVSVSHGQGEACGHVLGVCEAVLTHGAIGIGQAVDALVGGIGGGDDVGVGAGGHA